MNRRAGVNQLCGWKDDIMIVTCGTGFTAIGPLR